MKWYMKCFIYHFTSILHGLIRTHKWPAPNVSGFIAQLVRASHRYFEVTGSNPVEVLTFSGFCSQLLKLPSKLRWSWLTWNLSISARDYFVHRDSGYYLRDSVNKVNIPQPHANYYKNSFSYSGTVLWNSLPLELRKAESLNQFKRLIKEVI